MSALVHYSLDDHVATVTLDRPDQLNALSTAMVDALVDAFDRAHADDDVWVVLLRSASDRAFWVGRDLKEVLAIDADPDRHEPVPMRGARRNVFEVVAECGRPTVAALRGHTLGGGAELALACDVRLAADDLQLGFPEVQRGFGANFASVALARVVPPPVAYDLLYTGRRIDAAEALAHRLVNRVVPVDDLDATAADYVATIAANAPLTTRRYKAMMLRGQSLPLSAALRLDAAPDPYRSQDRREGVAAWREQRPARWQAR